MILLPLWITGGLSLTALLAFPTDGLAILAGITVAGCVGDVWLVARLRGRADDLLVQDSPSEIGCDVLSPPREMETCPALAKSSSTAADAANGKQPSI
jgi:hypothetical protein